MPSVTPATKRPVGRALIVGSATSRAQPLAAMQALGYTCAEVDDPYAATAEVCRRPLVYRAVILSLAGLYREELALIGMMRTRLPHIEVWLTHTEGRQSALAESMRLGAVGLLGEDGSLHRASGPPAPEEPAQGLPTERSAPHASPPAVASQGSSSGEPLLSAEELRALLAEQPDPAPEVR